MRLFARFAVAAFVFACLPHVTFGLPVDLPNPGAEVADTANPDMPAGVVVWRSDKVLCAFSRDTSVKRSDAASFHISNQGRPDAPRDVGQSAMFILTGDVVPGLSYTVSGYVRARNIVEGGDAGFHVRLQSDKGAWVDVDPKCDVVRDDRDWSRIEATFTAPPGAKVFKLFLIVHRGGEAWFDDLEMRDDLEDYSQRRFSQLIKVLSRLGGGDSAGAGPLAEAVARANKRLEQVKQLAAKPVDLPTQARRRFVDDARDLDTLIFREGRALSLAKSAEEAAALEGSTPPYLLGFAPSTQHVFLEDLPFEMKVAAETSILAVRGETEALQLVIVPLEESLQGVSVSVSDLAGSENHAILASSIVVKPVGFVHVRQQAGDDRYGPEFNYLGWWPDP
ncbi:MAG: hypothetical protein V2A58_07825, partial [Planctomycetota bacterium]